jgi:hypothetical protein
MCSDGAKMLNRWPTTVTRTSLLDVLDKIHAEPNFLHNVIAEAETWILFQHDPETKRQEESVLSD